MKITHSAGGVVLNPSGEILVVQQNQNSWSLPKGHLEEGETPLEAARREIREESGIGTLEYVMDLGVYERYRLGLGCTENHSERKKITMYLFQTAQTQLKPEDPKISEAVWLPKKTAAECLTHPADRQFLEKVLKQL